MLCFCSCFHLFFYSFLVMLFMAFQLRRFLFNFLKVSINIIKAIKYLVLSCSILSRTVSNFKIPDQRSKISTDLYHIVYSRYHLELGSELWYCTWAVRERVFSSCQTITISVLVLARGTNPSRPPWFHVPGSMFHGTPPHCTSLRPSNHPTLFTPIYIPHGTRYSTVQKIHLLECGYDFRVYCAVRTVLYTVM